MPLSLGTPKTNLDLTGGQIAPENIAPGIKQVRKPLPHDKMAINGWSLIIRKGKVATTPCQKELVEVIQTSDLDACWTPLICGVLGMCLFQGLLPGTDTDIISPHKIWWGNYVSQHAWECLSVP